MEEGKNKEKEECLEESRSKYSFTMHVNILFFHLFLINISQISFLFLKTENSHSVNFMI